MRKIIKNLIKRVAKLFIPYKYIEIIRQKRQMQIKHGDSIFNVWKYLVFSSDNKKESCYDYVRQMKLLFKRINVNVDNFFIYPFDSKKRRTLQRGKSVICSITPDFGKILDSNLTEIQERLKTCKNKKFSTVENDMANAIISLSDRIIAKVGKCNTSRANFYEGYLPRMLKGSPDTFEEALQKILFYNALFWQANHWHIGLGRLDKILYPYYQKDIESGIINRQRAKKLLIEFCKVLNEDFRAKSMCLYGDTGQYILLGGIEENGETIQNEITELFIEVVEELKLPDPKLILRVNKDTNSIVWQKSISCISTGCGSPLLMNESLIMSNMLRFGYKKEHLCQVGTSACWEPLIIGKSFDQNNPLPSIISVQCVNNTISDGIEYPSFELFFESFKTKLSNAIYAVAHDLEFDCSPLLSLFMDDCITKEKDYTQDGAVYSFHGMQIVSFPNTINALLNIKRYVYDEKYFSLSDCLEVINNNYDGHEDMKLAFSHNTECFGSSSKEAITLTNSLLEHISKTVSKIRINGKSVKIGLSSPSYLNGGNVTSATLDGRLAGMPFAVHISPVSENVGIKEILDFAAAIKYPYNIINGNVVDFILPVSFINSPEKLEIILRDAVHNGVFEIQLNVFNVDILKDAKLHPERHKDLIVRVWGFSAYFNDLPESYKDNLIKRAELYER